MINTSKDAEGAGSPQDSRGLHNRLNRISHYDFNVSDLERSRAWYEATTPLRTVAHTCADQAFPSLGISQGRFEGYMLKDPTQDGGFPMVHLVEWKSPKPVGRPYATHNHVGWYRMVSLFVDMDEARRGVIAQGSEPFFPTTDRPFTYHPDWPPFRYQTFSVHDPDGITIQFGAANPDYPPKTPCHVATQTSDLDRYIGFWSDVLGLDLLSGVQTDGLVPNVYDPFGGETESDGAFFGMRGDNRVIFEPVEWAGSRQSDPPYESPNSLGIRACAFEVDDIEASYRILSNLGQNILGAPEEWNLGEEFGTRTVLNFTDPEGIAFQLIQQPASPLATLHPYGYKCFP